MKVARKAGSGVVGSRDSRAFPAMNEMRETNDPRRDKRNRPLPHHHHRPNRKCRAPLHHAKSVLRRVKSNLILRRAKSDPLRRRVKNDVHHAKISPSNAKGHANVRDRVNAPTHRRDLPASSAK